MEGNIAPLSISSLFLNRKYEKSQFLPTTNTCCSRHGQCYISAWLLLFNPTVLAVSYYYLVPLYQSLQGPALQWGDRCRSLVASHTVCSFAASHGGQPMSSSTRSHAAQCCISERCFQLLLSEPSPSRYHMPVTGAGAQFTLFLCTRLLLLRNIYHPKQKYCHKVWIKSSLFCLRGNTVTGWYFPTLQ